MSKLKKYSLKKTWELCLAIQEYVADEWQKGRRSVSTLKQKGIKRHGIKEYIIADCFFCHYQVTHPRKKFRSKQDCPGCPGAEVAPRFNCYNSEWNTDPVKFYRTLKRMYAKWKKLH